MSKTVKIESAQQFERLLSSSKIVVTDFYADWCGPCKAVAPVFEKLSQSLSRPDKVTFTKVDTDAQQDLADLYQVNALPTFIVFQDGKVLQKVTGADTSKLQQLVQTVANEADGSGANGSGSGGGGSSGGGAAALWLGAELPRGYDNVTDQVEIQSSEVLNMDADFAGVRALVNTSKPGSLGSAKSTEKDWVLSDTDEQLLLFVPFQSTLKLHTLQITSISDDDEDVARPGTIKLFTNRAHNLGFDEAESEAPVQTIELGENDWNANSTANIPLRFVKYQNITSLVIFVESGAGDGEKTRIDRIRLIGETGEKRKMGELKKVEHEH